MKTALGMILSAAVLVITLNSAEDSRNAPVPAIDRVGFPKNYQQTFQVLRVVNRDGEGRVVTVFGNKPASSITRTNDLPYPYGSIIVMETSGALKGSDGKPAVDDQGHFRKDKVLGLHVMRREKGFGEAYGDKRAGEWEFVEYKADGSYITPPQKSAVCAECHIKAGAGRDYVYRGRIPADPAK